jgi:cobalt-precorrin 5A hydrolase
MKIALGLGCDRGTPAATIANASMKRWPPAVRRHSDVWAVASIDLKANESGCCT